MLEFSLADLTWGQLEFLTDYTGRTNDEMLEAFGNRQLTGKDIIAVLAVAENPDDPRAALESVRKTRVADVRMNFADISDEELEEVKENN